MRSIPKKYGMIGALLLWCVASPTQFVEAAGSDPTQVHASRVTDEPKQRIYIDCESISESDVIALRRRLIDEGANRVNLFFSAVMTFEAPVGTDPARLIGDKRFSFVEESMIGPAKSALRGIARVKQYYDEAIILATDSPSLTPSVDFEDRVVVLPPEVIEKSRWRPIEGVAGKVARQRAANENAQFLIGDILIRLIYPESGGAVNTESWTDEELRDANQGAVSGALAFQQTYAYVTLHFVFTADQRVRTGYEPIRHTMASDEDTWIRDSMTSLGYPGFNDTPIQVHNFNNDGRSRFGTDWVYTAFIANSRNEPGHIFSGSTGGAGYTAYANLGGPYLVIPFPAGANNPNGLTEIQLFSQIFQHEMVHVFWGLDEYISAPGECSDHSGYLDYENRNRRSVRPDGVIVGCPTYVNCLMWNARAAAEDGRPFCFYTAGQIGVVDANGNNIPDVFDMPPTVEFETALQETLVTPDIVVEMKAVSQAVPNMNPALHDRESFAAPLKDAVLNIDGVGEIRLDPADGRWDEPVEDLTFTLQGLTAGLTRIQIRARNTYGASSPTFEKKVYFLGLKYGLFTFRVERDMIETQWQLIGETFGAKIDLYRIATSGASPDTVLVLSGAQPEDPDELFKQFTYQDRDVEPGHSYRYFVKGAFSAEYQGEVQEFRSASNDYGVRAMLPMKSGQRVSHVAPNPFRETTNISIDIPRSFSQSDVNDKTGGIPTEVPTEITIRIYDVKGRRVKDVFAGSLFSRIETFIWDGTNSKGEPVPSGIYFVKAAAGTVQEVRKVVVVR